MKNTLILICLLFFSIGINAEKLEVSQVHNPKLDGPEVFVSDINNVLSLNERNALNRRCSELEKSLGVEIAIVIVPGINGDDEYGFAYDLFNNWKIGKEGKNTGLLWLYVEDIRAMKFETGLGLEGLLPDAFLNRVLEEVIFPRMKKGEVDAAFDEGLQAVIANLTTDAAREELLLNTGTTENYVVNIISIYLTVAFAVLILLALYFYSLSKKMRGENNVLYFKISPAVTTAHILAFLFPLPIFFFWKYAKRFQNGLRNKQQKCDHCGGTMRLLSEKEEDEYLNPEQQAEENVKSVDYDVWKCNVCDHVKILAYKNINTNYTRCPNCGARTYSLVSDDVLKPATSHSTGRGEKVHECANCKFRKVVPYVIPMIVVASGASSRGGSGGGFSGGSFGGGMSGGGGAGGRF